MPSNTTNFGWRKPNIYGDDDQWGKYINETIDAIDAKIFDISGKSSAFVIVEDLTTAAIDDAIAKATADQLGIFFPPGVYACVTPSIIDANIPYIFGAGQATRLKAQAGFTGSSILQVAAAGHILGAPRQHVSIKNMILDGNGQGVDGLVCYKAQNLLIENINAVTCRNGFFFDGQYDVRILNILLRLCYTGACTVGYKFNGPVPQTTSFDTFLMESCASESDATGVYHHGEGNNRLNLVGCEIQNSSVAGIDADGTIVSLIGTYIETHTPTTIPSVKLVNGAVLTQDAASVATYPSVDATSRVLPGPGAIVAGYRYSAPQVIGVSDVLTGAVQLWGPPNFPVDGRGGYTAYVGQIYTDPQGVRWICRLGGNSLGVPTYPRWEAMDGEIRIPINLTTLANGTRLWWPQNDFVLQQVEFVCTITAVGGTSFEIGIDNGALPQAVLSAAQCTTGAALTAGKIISARDNLHATAILTAFGARTIFRGTEHNAVPPVNNYLGYLKTGTFTAGAGILIIRGYYPKVLTRGTAAFVAGASTLTGTRQLLDGWSQVSPIGAPQVGVTMLDAVCPRGDPFQGRLLLRAGAMTALIARLSAAKTAGLLVVIPSWSSDNGVVWNNMAGISVPDGAYSAVLTFAPDLWTFPAQAMLRFQVTTDAAFLPLANDIDAGIEITQ